MYLAARPHSHLRNVLMYHICSVISHKTQISIDVYWGSSNASTVSYGQSLLLLQKAQELFWVVVMQPHRHLYALKSCDNYTIFNDQLPKKKIIMHDLTQHKDSLPAALPMCKPSLSLAMHCGNCSSTTARMLQFACTRINTHHSVHWG